MEMTHITAFTDAMKRKDLEEMLTHMADDVVLNTYYSRFGLALNIPYRLKASLVR